MIYRIIALVLTAWGLGLVIFVVTLPGPGNDRKTDAIVVLTGGKGRIERGITLMSKQRAKRMLVSGVGQIVSKSAFAKTFPADATLFACCIDLGYEAVDTRSNAEETQRWVMRHSFRTIRLVTSDWHMPRAQLELEHSVSASTAVIPDAVETAPELVTLIREYNKWLVRRAALMFGF